MLFRSIAALALAADSPRRDTLRLYAQTWASQAMARRLVAFYERVISRHEHDPARAKAGEPIPKMKAAR